MRRPLVILLAALSIPTALPAQADSSRDSIIVQLVGRLDLERYKATIRGLTKFGDRRQGTDRNRAALDWIEAQLKSYGCSNTERIRYMYEPPAPGAAAARPRPAGGRPSPGGARVRGERGPTAVNN